MKDGEVGDMEALLWFLSAYTKSADGGPKIITGCAEPRFTPLLGKDQDMRDFARRAGRQGPSSCPKPCFIQPCISYFVSLRLRNSITLTCQEHDQVLLWP